jgi:ribosomal protein L25 (general stress protein Ctc)
MKKPKNKTEKVTIIFGTNQEEKKTYTFKTEEQKKFFMQGVEEANGWLSYEIEEKVGTSL